MKNYETPFLSVVIPAFNEEHRITPTIIDFYTFFDSTNILAEVIVVDDGSSDKTELVIKQLQAHYPTLQLISLAHNQGKGAAVRTGILASNGSIILYADADGSTPAIETVKLLQAITNGADIAIGSRAISDNSSQVTTSTHRKVLGRIFNYLVNLLAVPLIHDTQCGFKMFRKAYAHQLFKLQKSKNFSFDVEILLLAQRARLKIKEVPINWTNVEGSKVNLLRDPLKMLLDVLRFPFLHPHKLVFEHPNKEIQIDSEI